MKTYRVKEYSAAYTFFSIISLMFSSMLILGLSEIFQNDIAEVSFLVIVVVGVLILPYFIGIAKSDITIDDQGIKKIWVRRRLFSRSKNQVIKWDDLDYCAIDSGGGRGPSTHILEIGLKNRNKLIIAHLDFYDKKDDFRKLVDDLFEKIIELNSHRGSEPIRFGAPVFHRNSLLVFMAASIAVAIGVPAYILLKHKTFAPSYWIIIAAAILFAFIGYSAYTYVKNEFKGER